MKFINFSFINKKKSIVKNNIKKKSIFFNKNVIKHSLVFNEKFVDSVVLNSLDEPKIDKSFERWVSLNIPASAATLLPPVGPFLGQHGFNTMNFCNSYNELTKIYPKGTPLKVKIKLFEDKTILFKICTPPITSLIFGVLLHKNLITFNILDILKICILKKIDSTDLSLISLTSSLLGTLRSMKIKL